MRILTTGHRKILVTLGVGAVALTAIACASAAPDDGLLAGTLPPSELSGGPGGNEFALGAPAPGFADAGIPEMIAITSEDNTAGTERCNEGGDSHDLTVPIEPISLGMPAPGFADAGIPEMIVVTSEDNTAGIELYNEGGDSHDLTVPILYGTPVLITVDPPEPVQAPTTPSTRPIAEQAGGATEDGPPSSISGPVIECGSGASEPGVSIEPVSDTDRALLNDFEAGTGEELPDGVTIVEAPIESAGVSIAESFPPQYFLQVVSGLSNGATTFGNFAVKRDGNVVAVSVTNYVRTDMPAIQLYGIHRSNIALGSEFTSGETYAIVINGEPITEFTAQ